MKDYSELIDKLCDGTVNPAEQEQADHLIRQDPEFARQIEAQRDIIEHLEMLAQRDRVKQYHQEYLQGETKTIPFYRKTWWMAASVLLFVSAATFAFIKIVIPDTQRFTEQVFHSNQPDLAKIPQLKIQQYHLQADQDMQVTGEAGTQLAFPAGCLLDQRGFTYSGPYNLHLMEVTDQKVIRKMVAPDQEFSRLFYIKIQEQAAILSIDPLMPPLLLEQDKLFKGRIDQEKLVFKPALVTTDLVPLLEVNSYMEEYQRYQRGQELLDSIGLYYELAGDQYRLKNGHGLQLGKAFVEETRQFVEAYQSEPVAIRKAAKAWQIYTRQRQIQVNQTTGDGQPNWWEGREVLEFGWYGVR
ncbi:MAG: hypothetical protein ACNS62_01920 [Candidatus Cyclobacteriaceae bacterium M3_2C_046]